MSMMPRNDGFINVSPKTSRKQKMGELLLNNSTKAEPIYGWGQALAKALAIGAGVNSLNKADESEAEAAEIFSDSASKAAPQWIDPDTGTGKGKNYKQNLAQLLQESGNEDVASAASKYALEGGQGIEDRRNEVEDYQLAAAAKSKYGLLGNGAPPSNTPSGAAPNNSVPMPQLTGNPIVDEKIMENYGKKVGEGAAAAPAQAGAKSRLDDIFIQMSGRFNELEKMGGSPGSQDNLIDNLSAWYKNTEGEAFGIDTPLGGQDFQRMQGTPEQAIRETLKGDIGDVKTEYQKAAGLSSKQLDSNQEAQQFMKSLPNLLNQNKSNQERIADMSERFANSVAKAKIEAERGGQQQPPMPVQPQGGPQMPLTDNIDEAEQMMMPPAQGMQAPPIAIPSLNGTKLDAAARQRRYQELLLKGGGR